MPAQVHQVGQPHIEDPFKQGVAQVSGRQAKQRESGLVGSGDPASLRKSHHAFGHGADALGERMEVQADTVAMADVEDAVLDHLSRGTDQVEDLGRTAPQVARDVDYPEQPPVGRRHRGGRAGEERVALKVMFGAMDDHWGALGQGRADGVGAPVLLIPGGARHQGHALGPG